MGLLGCAVGFTVLYWNDFNRMQRGQGLCLMVFLILMNLLVGLGSKNIDNNGHIGGLIMGVLLGFFVLEPKEEKKEKWSAAQKYSFIFILLSFISGFLIFYYWLEFMKIVVESKFIKYSDVWEGISDDLFKLCFDLMVAYPCNNMVHYPAMRIVTCALESTNQVLQDAVSTCFHLSVLLSLSLALQGLLSTE